MTCDRYSREEAVLPGELGQMTVGLGIRAEERAFQAGKSMSRGPAVSRDSGAAPRTTSTQRVDGRERRLWLDPRVSRS